MSKIPGIAGYTASFYITVTYSNAIRIGVGLGLDHLPTLIDATAVGGK